MYVNQKHFLAMTHVRLPRYVAVTFCIDAKSIRQDTSEPRLRVDKKNATADYVKQCCILNM